MQLCSVPHDRQPSIVSQSLSQRRPQSRIPNQRLSQSLFPSLSLSPSLSICCPCLMIVCSKAEPEPVPEPVPEPASKPDPEPARESAYETEPAQPLSVPHDSTVPEPEVKRNDFFRFRCRWKLWVGSDRARRSADRRNRTVA